MEPLDFKMVPLRVIETRVIGMGVGGIDDEAIYLHTLQIDLSLSRMLQGMGQLPEVVTKEVVIASANPIPGIELGDYFTLQLVPYELPETKSVMDIIRDLGEAILAKSREARERAMAEGHPSVVDERPATQDPEAEMNERRGE